MRDIFESPDKEEILTLNVQLFPFLEATTQTQQWPSLDYANDNTQGDGEAMT